MFSGIEAATVAFSPLGWTPVAFAEIDKFPSAVLVHHYPDVPNLGDVTKIDTSTLGAVDVLCGGSPCFPSGALVLSERGYVPIESLKVGDAVVTHRGRMQRIVRIGSRISPIGELKGVGICEPIICTPDHPFLSVAWRNQSTKRNNQYAVIEHCGGPEWTSASSMPGRQWCALTQYAPIEHEPIPTGRFTESEALYVAGLYLGGGHIRVYRNKAKLAVVLSLNPDKYAKLVAEIGENRHGVSYQRTSVRATICDTEFARWLTKEFGRLSHLKNIPAWVLSHPLRAIFLRGFLDADGCRRDSVISVSTTSRALAYGVAALLTTEGFVSSVALVKTPDTTVIEGRTVNQRDYWHIRAWCQASSRKARVRHGYLLRKMNSFELCGEAEVFNIEVEDDHSYIVNGAIVHNCQSFSIAGARNSLDDERGNLTLVFVELAHELADGNGLRNVIWENVPGVLNTEDNAFGCFLAGLVGADDPLVPPGAVWGEMCHFDDESYDVHRTYGWQSCSWPDEGMVEGPLARCSWRVFDAQYFGLAQRRRRVVLVADFGNGADPAAVLFERAGVPGNSPPSRETGEGVAGTIAARTKGGGGLGTDFDLDGELIPSAVNYAPEIARCVATREGSSQDYESTTMVAVGVTGEVAHTLKAEGADASEDGTGRGTPIVCVHGTQDSCTPETTAFALGLNNGCENVIAFSAKDYGADASNDIAPTLRAGGHTGSHANAGVMPAICQTVARRGREGGATAELGGDIATALRASSGGGDKPHVLTSAVRRLTPRECERLMGFPDDYLLIPYRGKPASKCPDGPRYKALGNSWAVPLFAWIGRRIQATVSA